MVGTAFGAITNSLVKDIIMPPIGFLVGGIDFSQLAIVLKDAEQYETLAEAVTAGAPVLRYGAFINTVINFFIIAFTMFLVVKGSLALSKWRRKEEASPTSPVTPPREVVLLEEIRDLLKVVAKAPE